MVQNNKPDPLDANERPSKTQIKQEMHALLALGKRLVDTPSERLKRLKLDERLEEAIRAAQRTTSREARRRQIHYVGKLMREAPAEAIETQLDAWDKGSATETAHMHRIERDRDRLLASDEHLTEWLERHPKVDIQEIRSVIRAARQEQSHNDKLKPEQPPKRKHYRALFQAIKTAYDEQKDSDSTPTTLSEE